LSNARTLSLDNLTIGPGENIETALRKMTDNHKGILFVCGSGYHLIGILTDGDIRRSLLEKTLLMAPISKVMNTDPITAKSVQEGKESITAKKLIAIPVLDNQGFVEHLIIDQSPEPLIISVSSHDGASTGFSVDSSEVLAIITARGGSKRIPHKNLSKVGGKSLIEWAIQAAKAASKIGNIHVSTDDDMIAEAAKVAGISVPWMRPADLAQDDSTSISVVLHEVKKWIREKGPIKIVLLLEPTVPMRNPEDLNSAIDLLSSTNADSVVSVCQLPHQFHPEETLQIKDNEVSPYLRNRTMKTRRLRGNQDPAYVLSGVVYAVKVDSLLAHGSLFGKKTIPLETAWDEFTDIDHPTDLQRAEIVLKSSS